MKLLLSYRIGDSVRRVTTRSSFPGGRILASSLMVCKEIISCCAWDYRRATPCWEDVWTRENDGTILVHEKGLEIL